jgi:hypothetical protein
LTPCYRALLLAVIYRAVLDARRGDVEARDWLTTGGGRDWADVLELPYWPPDIETKCQSRR